MRTVLVIDPVQASVREEGWSGDYAKLYQWVRCDLLERVEFNGNVLWVDEEGGLKRNTPKWYHPELHPIPISGVGVLVPSKAGRYTAQSLNATMKWGLLMGPQTPTLGRA